MSERRPRPVRSEFRVFRSMQTRWQDNDAYGHVNNVVYYGWFDTAVNAWLIENGLLDPTTSPVIGLVAETGCSYFESVSFPETVEIGMAVARIGTSSVTYRLGVFREGAEQAAALGGFVHVHVERATQRPVAIPPVLRRALEGLAS